MDDNENFSEPVNRTRRYRFVSVTVFYCLTTAAFFAALTGLGYFVHETLLIVTYVEGMIGLATAVTLAYITGSVIDYNGGIKPTFTGSTVRKFKPTTKPVDGDDAKG